MDFAWSNIEVVKSVSQRGLAHYWDRLESGRSLPPLARFEPNARMQDPALLMFTSIKRDAGRDRYLIHHYGSRLLEASGVEGKESSSTRSFPRRSDRRRWPPTISAGTINA